MNRAVLALFLFIAIYCSFRERIDLDGAQFVKSSKWAVIFSDSISGNKDFETNSTLISQNTSIETSGMICIVWI